VAINEALKVQKGEQVLIISNPAPDVDLISKALFDAALEARAAPVLIYQKIKTQIDFAEPILIAAFQAKPQVVISISKGKLGKDEKGILTPYQFNGKGYDHIFHLLQYGEKATRAFWSPSISLDTWERTVCIDYALLKKRCLIIKEILDKAESVHISAPGGTDITISVKGREAKLDDGDFSFGGSGGNLPAGEVFISPANGTSSGKIVFDGSISVHNGEFLIDSPVTCIVEGGFVKDISGGNSAVELLKTITLAEERALEFESKGKIARGNGEIYARNSRNIGELGIGLNPAAKITGNMLEDEKAFNTCHFAIGQNYDEDAPSLIHLDSLVRRPTITAYFPDGSSSLIEKDGDLVPAL